MVNLCNLRYRAVQIFEAEILKIYTMWGFTPKGHKETAQCFGNVFWSEWKWDLLRTLAQILQGKFAALVQKNILLNNPEVWVTPKEGYAIKWKVKVKVEDNNGFEFSLANLLSNLAFKPICISYWELLIGTTVRCIIYCICTSMEPCKFYPLVSSKNKS